MFSVNALRKLTFVQYKLISDGGGGRQRNIVYFMALTDFGLFIQKNTDHVNFRASLAFSSWKNPWSLAKSPKICNKKTWSFCTAPDAGIRSNATWLAAARNFDDFVSENDIFFMENALRIAKIRFAKLKTVLNSLNISDPRFSSS